MRRKKQKKQIIVKSGELRIEIEKEWSLCILARSEKITGSGWRDLAYMKTELEGFAHMIKDRKMLI
ncbi:MAG: hypothetical protein ACLR7N_12370 [Roseburia hominis]